MTFIFAAQACDRLLITDYGVSKGVLHFPMFLIGMLLADMECYPKGQRPLDALRDLGWGLSILRNLGFITIFLFWGSYPGHDTVKVLKDQNADGFFRIVTFGFYLPQELAYYLAAIAGMLLALTSEAT